LVIEQVFGVQVISVNTYLLPNKKRRLGKFEGFENRYKRVFITLVCLLVIFFDNEWYLNDFDLFLIKFLSLLIYKILFNRIFV
jgi:hypothetical protein